MALEAGTSAIKELPLRDLTIWIDSYDDLFSDFDSRPYLERVISDDFIAEINKLMDEKGGYVGTLRFQIPAEARDANVEGAISSRLPRDFERQFQHLTEQYQREKRAALFMTFCGTLSLFIALTITSLSPAWWHNLVLVVCEPAGWFLIWTGLDTLVTGTKPVRRKRDFYARLSDCKVEFVAL